VADEGQAVVEMALSSAVLFAMFFGIFEASMACYTSNYVSDAAREATRWAIVRGGSCTKNSGGLMDHCGATQTDIATYVQSLNYPGIRSANLTTTASWYTPSSKPPTASWTSCSGSGCNASGNLVQVVVTYTFPLAVPFLPSRSLSLSSTSQMVISQ
jgi:Flp pilus assembly protein TadG